MSKFRTGSTEWMLENRTVERDCLQEEVDKQRAALSSQEARIKELEYKVKMLKAIACNCEPMIGFTCPIHDGSWDKSIEARQALSPEGERK